MVKKKEKMKKRKEKTRKKYILSRQVQSNECDQSRRIKDTVISFEEEEREKDRQL